LESLVIDGRIILKCLLNKLEERALIGVIWVRIGANVGLL
jgi:hypothetical protein